MVSRRKRIAELELYVQKLEQARDAQTELLLKQKAEIHHLVNLNDASIGTVQILLESIDKVRETCEGILGDTYEDVSIEQLMDMVQIHVLNMEERLRG